LFTSGVHGAIEQIDKYVSLLFLFTLLCSFMRLAMNKYKRHDTHTQSLSHIQTDRQTDRQTDKRD